MDVVAPVRGDDESARGVDPEQVASAVAASADAAGRRGGKHRASVVEPPQVAVVRLDRAWSPLTRKPRLGDHAHAVPPIGVITASRSTISSEWSKHAVNAKHSRLTRTSL